MNPADGYSKIDVKPGDNGTGLPTGEYKFNGSDFYYRDYDRDFILHLVVSKAEKKAENTEAETNADAPTETVSIACIGGTGYSRTTGGVSGSVDVITDMTIISDNKILVTTKKVIFNIGNGAPKNKELYVEAGELNQTESKLSDVYANKAEIALYKAGEHGLESRTNINEIDATQEKGKEVKVQKWSRVSYAWIDPNAPKETEEEASSAKDNKPN